MSEPETFDAGGDRGEFFISYRRSADDDRSLASYLKRGLEDRGHEVFIDVGMTIGISVNYCARPPASRRRRRTSRPMRSSSIPADRSR